MPFRYDDSYLPEFMHCIRLNSSMNGMHWLEENTGHLEEDRVIGLAMQTKYEWQTTNDYLNINRSLWWQKHFSLMMCDKLLQFENS